MSRINRHKRATGDPPTGSGTMDALPWLLMPVFSVPRFFNNLGLLFIASRQRSSEILGEPCGGASRMYPAGDFRRLRRWKVFMGAHA